VGMDMCLPRFQGNLIFV